MRPLLLALLLAPAAVGAQVRTADQVHVWVNHFGDYLIGDHLALYQEVFARRAEEGATRQQRHFAQGVTWIFNPTVRVAVGHTYVRTSPYGELPVRDDVDENRAWTHVMLSHNVGRLRVTHRTRAEYRWVEAAPEWTRTARWRQLVRAVYPLPDKWYVAGGGETFIRLSPAAQQGDLEQTRATLMVGRTIAKGTNLEAGWQEQRLRRARERERNQTIMLSLRATWRLH